MGPFTWCILLFISPIDLKHYIYIYQEIVCSKEVNFCVDNIVINLFWTDYNIQCMSRKQDIFMRHQKNSCQRCKQQNLVIHNLTTSWRAQHPASQSYQTSGSVIYLGLEKMVWYKQQLPTKSDANKTQFREFSIATILIPLLHIINEVNLNEKPITR